MDDTHIEIYLSGEKLYGDDFTTEEILEWFKDEKEGYAELLASLAKEGVEKDPLLNLQGNYGYHVPEQAQRVPLSAQRKAPGSPQRWRLVRR